MKMLKTILLSVLFIMMATIGVAQTKTKTFTVAGECGMCKKKIESTAKGAGASNALWNMNTKALTVKYNSTSTNKAKIEKAIAAVGYDTPDYKTTEAAYNNLHTCCKYERGNTSFANSCCNDAACKEAACTKDGACAKDMSCCKEVGCDKKDCCKKG